MIKYRKHWINFDRRTPEFEKCLDEYFLDIAFSQPGVKNQIRCPCPKCNNGFYKLRHEVQHHVRQWGIEKSYKKWVYHGESLHDTSLVNESELNETIHDGDYDSATYEMLYDMFRGENLGETLGDFSNLGEHSPEEPNEGAKKFQRLLKDAEHNLYPNCGLSKLSFIVKLFQMKCLYGWSNNSVDALLSFLKSILPRENTCPASFYDARKVIRDLGLDYQKIDACVNDCILFWGNEYADLDRCPKCNHSRWATGKETKNDGSGRKKVPQKTLRYFPLKPRLQRFFMCKETALAMRWHKEKRIDDGVLRHPADSIAWKTFDEKHAQFASDCRNIRLGLASDGFNPFGNMSISHSTWPVVLIPYNFPPWSVLKHSNWMLSLLIPGPKSPGNSIDIYL